MPTINVKQMLKELEGNDTTTTNGDMEHDEILINVLGQADAARLPVREWDSPLVRNRYHQLRRLRTGGLDFRQNATEGDAARKRGEGALIAVAEAGFITIVRGRTKFPRVALTQAGEARARALAGLPNRNAGRLLLKFVTGHTKRNPSTLDELWMPEIAANRGNGWGPCDPKERELLATIELEFCAGFEWLDCASDCHGRVYYSVRPEGWNELDNPVKPPRVGPLPPESEELQAIYCRVRDAALFSLSTTEPPFGELGGMPLPASMKGQPIPATPAITIIDQDEPEPEPATAP